MAVCGVYGKLKASNVHHDPTSVADVDLCTDTSHRKKAKSHARVERACLLVFYNQSSSINAISYAHVWNCLSGL